LGSAATFYTLYIGLAISGEVMARSALKTSDGFTRFMPSLVVAAGYVAAFSLLVAIKKIAIRPYFT
jgi:multidrug transporter EmrE-like cation transporter